MVVSSDRLIGVMLGGMEDPRPMGRDSDAELARIRRIVSECLDETKTELTRGLARAERAITERLMELSSGTDPYQGDLSQVVAKYLGETEEALRRLLEEAESGLTVSVFDEADDLFGWFRRGL
jgi:hypothetical protein